MVSIYYKPKQTKGKPVFSNGSKSTPKTFHIVLFYAMEFLIILADKPFEKAIWSLETYALVNSNLCWKLFSLLESTTTFDETF